MEPTFLFLAVLLAASVPSDRCVPNGSDVNGRPTPSLACQVSQPTTSLRRDGFEVRRATGVFDFRAGVIVDSTRSIAYFMHPQGGIGAIDLSSGRLLWSSSKAAKPLLLHQDLLVAQAELAAPSNLLRIVVLNARDAGALLFEAAVRLPGDVQVAIDDGLGKTFRTSARLHENDVIVSWRFSEQHISGAPTGPDAAVRVSAGVVRIDLETGSAESLEPEAVPPEPEMRLPDQVARLIKQGAAPSMLWQVGNVEMSFKAVVRTSNPPPRASSLSASQLQASTPKSIKATSSRVAVWRRNFQLRRDGCRTAGNRRSGATAVHVHGAMAMAAVCCCSAASSARSPWLRGAWSTAADSPSATPAIRFEADTTLKRSGVRSPWERIHA